MKKHLLSAFGLIAACTISATQYMHINLPDGKEYDVKVEKTDHVTHVKEGEEVFIKVSRTDNSYSLYPSTGAEVTFDEETFVTEGDTEANFGGGTDVPVITAAYFGGMLIEGTIGGTYVIEYSEDGVNWTKADEITLTASSMYWADLTSANQPKRLYRAKVK